jgi:hypothetical protein
LAEPPAVTLHKNKKCQWLRKKTIGIIFGWFYIKKNFFCFVKKKKKKKKTNYL